MVKRSAQGFTLIELMIVVAILGVLAAIAYPSYQRYVIKTKRADMMVEMQQISSKIEANKTSYIRYDRIPLNTIFTNTVSGTGTTFPNSGTPIYDITITPSSGTTLGGEQWTLTASPIEGGQMASDGYLTLNYLGERCRIKGTDKKCGKGEEWSK